MSPLKIFWNTTPSTIFAMMCSIFLSSYNFGFAVEDASEKYETFTGVVSGNRVNVRASCDISSEAICQLKEADEIKVVGKEKTWYKVELPKNALLYIHKTDVERKDDAAFVMKERADVKAAATQTSTVVGSLHKGSAIKIIREYLDWYEIEAPKATFGWMHSDYVRKHMGSETRKAETVKDRLGQSEHPKAEEEYEEKPKAAATYVQEEKPFIGVIEDVGKIYGRRSNFKLTRDSKLISYLTSSKVDLKNYIDLKVNVWGIKSESKRMAPLIEVDAIQVIQ